MPRLYKHAKDYGNTDSDCRQAKSCNECFCKGLTSVHPTGSPLHPLSWHCIHWKSEST